MATSATTSSGGNEGGDGGPCFGDLVRGRVTDRVENPKRPKHKNICVGEPRKSGYYFFSRVYIFV